MPAPAFTTDPSIITVMSERLRALPVQYMSTSAILMLLIKSGSVLNTRSPSIEIPFYIGGGASGAAWIGPDDTLPEGGSRELAMGFADNRFIGNGWSWNILEQAITRDMPDRLFNEMELKAKEVERAMAQTMAYSMWYGAGGKELDGITSFVEAAAPAAQTAIHLGVDKAANPWFRNQFVSLTAPAGSVGFGSVIPAIFLAITEAIEAATVGNSRPSHAITTRAIFNLLRRAFQETNRAAPAVSKLTTLYYGFESFEFDGVKFMWDNMCPDGSIFFLPIVDNRSASRVNNGESYGQRDSFWEMVGTPSPLELDPSGIVVMKHANVNNMIINQGTSGRRLTEGRYIIDSAQLICRRPSETARLTESVAGYASRWT
jgi:hypothetical protein